MPGVSSLPKELQIYRHQPVEFSEYYGRILRADPEIEKEYLQDNDLHSKSITFCVTEQCNLRCSYCYEVNKNPGRMSFETAKKCIDLLFEEDKKNSRIINKKKAHAIVLDFIGGDPLLEIELIDRICEYFLKKAILLNHRWQNRYMISMISNGVLYFTPAVQKFINKWRGRLSFSITIDGNKELHDACRKFPDGSPSFDFAQRAYLDCLKKGLTNSTKMTIAPDNLPFLSSAIIELFSYPGVNHVPANPIFEVVWTREQGKIYYCELKKIADFLIRDNNYKTKSTTLFYGDRPTTLEDVGDDNWCGGTGNMLAFDINGKIYPCIRYLPFTLQNKENRDLILLGDCNNGLLSNNKEKECFDCLESITRSSQSSKECMACPISATCSWCSGWNYDYYGTPNKRFTGICNMKKADHLASVYYWNILFQKEKIDKKYPLLLSFEEIEGIISKEEYNFLKELSL